MAVRRAPEAVAFAVTLAVALCAGAEPTSRPAAPPGSFQPGIYLDDVTYTIRSTASFKCGTVSPHDPETAFVGTFEGYLYRTKDGGKSWDESRLIPEAKPYFGDGWEQLYYGVHRSADASESALDGSEPERPATRRRTLTSMRANEETESGGGDSGRRGAASNVNFGIGVPGGAPRLQVVVRKFGKPTSGLNIKQMLYLRGSRPTTVRTIVVHPRDPRTVYACTAFGLFVSRDGGDSWVRTFLGSSPAGRETHHIAVDPSSDRRVLLATGEGVYISNDGGANFSRSPDKGVGEGTIRWLFYNPYDPRYVYAGTADGLLRSNDRGESWDYIYYTTFPAAREVRTVAIDPFDKKTGYIATNDGLYMTKDLLKGDLESWERLGGLNFTGVQIYKLAVCPKHRGHMWAITNMLLANTTDPGLWETGGAYLWETLDGGSTWNQAFSGTTNGTMQWFDIDPSDPDLLWIIWSRSLLRQRRGAPDLSARRVVIPDDPPIGDVIVAVQRYIGIDPRTLNRYRRRAFVKALVPQLDVAYHQYQWTDHGLNLDGLFPRLPFRFEDGYTQTHKELRVMLSWDLGNLVFNIDGITFGRVDRVSWEMRDIVLYKIHRTYGELRRLRVMMANDPPSDVRTRVIYTLRIEELRAYLDLMTGGYLTRWTQGDRPSGGDTGWFTPWPAPKKERR
jgi:photosystem II stability/assembly factor-like uncharacterized protein